MGIAKDHLGMDHSREGNTRATGVFLVANGAAAAGPSAGRICGVLLAIVMSLSQAQNVFAQSKAAQNAAGVMILQNSQMRQELRETKRELREIKEGLGIESTPSGDGSDRLPLPLAVLTILVGVLLAIGGAIWLCVRWRSDLKTIQRELEEARSDKDTWRVFKALCSGRGIPTQVLGAFALVLFFVLWRSYEGGAKDLAGHLAGQSGWKALEALKAYQNDFFNRVLFWLFAFASFASLWFTALFLYAKSLVHQPVVSETEGATQSIESADQSRQLEVKSPISVGAQQSPGISEAKQLWIRNLQRQVGGPYTKEQIAKAIAAGTITDGSEAASSPNGPWRKIVAKQSVVGLSEITTATATEIRAKSLEPPPIGS